MRIFFRIDTINTAKYNSQKCDTKEKLITLSLRITTKKEDKIGKAAIKAGKTKLAYIFEAVDEKLDLVKDREKQIREFAGWLSHAEAEELGKATEVFNQVNEGDWD